LGKRFGGSNDYLPETKVCGVRRKLVLILFGSGVLCAQTLEPSRESTLLEQGKTIERQFAGGESHEYRFALHDGEYAKILLFQRSINVAVECFGPDGNLRFDADSQLIDDTEIAELIGDASGIYRFRVTAPERQAPVGRYNITLQEVERATDRHKTRIAASRAYSQAWKTQKLPGRENLLKAIQNFETAAGYWHAASDLFEEARTRMIAGAYYAGIGDRQRAFDYELGAMGIAKASGNRRIEGWSYVDYALVLNTVGDKKQAIEYADRGLPILRELGDRAGEAAALNNLGRAYSQTGEDRKSIGYFEDAIRIYKEIQDIVMFSQVVGNLGTVYDNLGEYQRALDYHQQKLRLAREMAMPGAESLALNNIASCYSRLGEYQKALDGYTTSFEIARKYENQSQAGIALHNIASVYGSLGDHQHALTFYKEALEMVRQTGDPWAIGNTLNNIAATYGELGDNSSALRLHQEALTYRRAVSNASGEATSLGNIGKTYAKLGDREKARDHMERALAIRRKVGEPLPLAGTLRDLGGFYLEGGNHQRALPYLDEALGVSRTIQDRRGEAGALALTARLERDRGDFAAAHARAEEALSAFESLRRGVSSPTLRASFFTSARESLEIDIDSLTRLHAEHPEKGFAGAALMASERARARSLLEMLGETGVEIRRGVDGGLLARERQLQQLISAKADNQVRLLSREHSKAEAQAAATELDALTVELDQIQSRIRQESPQYAALTQPVPLDAKEIQSKVLDPDTVLLEYALGAKASYLWVATPSSIEVFNLPAKAAIEHAAKRVYELLTARNQSRAKETPAARASRVRQADEEFRAAASTASAMLLSPASSRIAGKRLLIVADGVLQYLPFGALPEPGAGQDAVPLIANHEIASAPSASVLAFLRQQTADRKPADKAVAILADPVFTSNDARVRQQQKSEAVVSPNAARRSAADLGVQEFVRLRFSRTEAEEIARLSPPDSTLKALDFDASRDTVLRPELGQYRIVHFATHSLLNNEHPELSGVVLSLVDRTGRPQNGFLRLYDIYNLRLASDLVVLSACQTALGGEIKGEGLIGLTRGFLYAGAPRVVATLWEIDDRTTAELMKRFYAGVLGRGERPAAALRASQIAMWESRGWEAPYYWAAFTLQGEWR
jgi:CHAT domain-containing protein/tetratricopeptide (TPR) repeat protein